jgi:tight adherence protein C
MSRASVLAFGAAVLVAAAIVEAAGGRGRGRRPTRLRPRGGVARALARVGRLLGVRSAPADLAARLEAAGAPPGVTAGDLMALKAGAACAAFAAALGPGALLPGRLGAVVLAAAPAGGFLAPDAWLHRRTRRRQAAMGSELAEVLDLLHVAVAAGMAPMRALGEVGARRGGTLGSELRAAATRAALGVPRADALRVLARRCPVHGMDGLVAALLRAERHGAPLAPSLRALALDARAQRAQRLRDHAARAAPKIQLVVALVLVPAVMLIVGACLAAGFL